MGSIVQSENKTITSTNQNNPIQWTMLYLCWCCSFWFFWILFVIGIPTTAAGLAALFGDTELSNQSVVRFYEWIFTQTAYIGILGTPLGGLIAPRSVIDSDRRRYWTQFSAALIGAWAVCIFILPRGLIIWAGITDPEHGGWLILPISILLVLVIFGIVFGVSYFVNRYAVWMTARVFQSRNSFHWLFGVAAILAFTTYLASYGKLREQGVIGFQERYYAQGGAFFRIDTPPHIRAKSKTIEWLFWIPAELELLFGSPDIELSDVAKSYLR